jgi:serralysin
MAKLNWAAAFVVAASLTIASCGSDEKQAAAPAEQGPNIIQATANHDAFQGGDSVDYVSYENATDRVYLVFGDLGHSTGWAAGDTFTSIEGVIGSPQSDIIGLDDRDNRIEGGAGDDELIGQGGNDTLIGGLGADVYGYRGAGFGNDTIEHFEIGDRVDFSRYAGLTFDQLTIAAAAGGVLVAVGEDSIFLGGATLDQVDRTRFVFR